MFNGAMMKQAIRSLDNEMRRIGREINAEAVAEIIQTHALATAASAAASGAIPGAGGAIAFGIACTSTVTMYGRLARQLGVTLSNGLIRAVVSAVAADLGAAIATTVAATAIISFVPGVGNMASAAITAITNYAFVYLAGLMFIKLVAAFGISRVQTMSQDEMQAAMHDVQEGIDMKSAMREARSSYKART